MVQKETKRPPNPFEDSEDEVTAIKKDQEEEASSQPDKKITVIDLIQLIPDEERTINSEFAENEMPEEINNQEITTDSKEITTIPNMAPILPPKISQSFVDSQTNPILYPKSNDLQIPNLPPKINLSMDNNRDLSFKPPLPPKDVTTAPPVNRASKSLTPQ